jgi:hypothetical protein
LKHRPIPHLPAIAVMLTTCLVVIAIWVAVQASRSDPLPTLVWGPQVTDAQVMAKSQMVLDRLGSGWWWVYATPEDRRALRQAGAHLAFALPTPLAQMAGCSI